jgi:hypothetical protein
VQHVSLKTFFYKFFTLNVLYIISHISAIYGYHQVSNNNFKHLMMTIFVETRSVMLFDMEKSLKAITFKQFYRKTRCT